MSTHAKRFLALMWAWALCCTLLLAAEAQDTPAQPRLRLDPIEEKLRQLEPVLERGQVGEPTPQKPSRPRGRTPQRPDLFKAVGPLIVVPLEEPPPEPAPEALPPPPPPRRGWIWAEVDDWGEFKRATTGD